uniref:Uncharacterized protein n=1 Tax=Callorhinchus milii TaxID=7868 RepID=A0A4W3JLB7_CALMI
MWETARRPTMLGDISSGSSGYQSGSNLTGTDLLEEHLREIRSLRQRLEESICTNDRLRQQLEVRLAAAAKESAGAPTSIYIQGLETMTQLTEENRKLRDENLTIEARLALIPREHKKELEQLKEVLLTTRARLKLTEAEMEQWSEENKRLQAEVRDRQQDLVQLREEQRCTQSHNNRCLSTDCGLSDVYSKPLGFLDPMHTVQRSPHQYCKELDSLYAAPFKMLIDTIHQ